MKKTLLIILLAIASAPAVFAQAAPGGATSSKDYTGGKVSDSGNTGFGVKGGYSLANFFGAGKDAIPKRDNLNTYNVGAYGQFGLNDFSSVQVELLYSRKGIRYTPPGAGITDLRLDYLALPILYVGNITDKFSFHVGPELALLTKVKNGSNDVDIKDGGYNSFDVSGVAGLEYRIGPARVGARYDLGLARVVNTAGVDRITNQVLQLYLGIGLTQ